MIKLHSSFWLTSRYLLIFIKLILIIQILYGILITNHIIAWKKRNSFWVLYSIFVINRIVIAYRAESKMYCKHQDVLSWVRETSQESIKYKIISVLSCVFPNEAIFAQKILLALLPVRVMSSDLKGDNDHNSVH